MQLIKFDTVFENYLSISFVKKENWSSEIWVIKKFMLQIKKKKKKFMLEVEDVAQC